MQALALLKILPEGGKKHLRRATVLSPAKLLKANACEYGSKPLVSILKKLNLAVAPKPMSLSNKRIQALGIGISLLLHALLAMLFLIPGPKHTSGVHPSATVQIIRGSSLVNKNQIVSPSQGKEVAKPPRTRLQAEKNVLVKKQQVKRGDPDAGPIVAKPQTQAPLLKAASQQQPSLSKEQTQPANKSASQTTSPSKAPAPTQKFQKQRNKPLDLKLKSLSNLALMKPETARQNPTKKTTLDFNAVQPFSRPSGSGARFLGLSGTSDHLPDLPDGDLTLLNTKAHKYAVFVRRVALRVFSALRASGWEHLARSDIMQIVENSVVRVRMNASGQIEDLRLVTASGSRSFDKSLLLASKASKDPNPPTSALNKDKTLTLEFHARTWSQTVPAGPRQPLRESRWLFLGTALY